MPDFKEIQDNLKNAKRNRAQSQQSVFLSEERLRKLNREKENLLRSSEADSEIIQNIIQEENSLRTQITEAKGQLEAHLNSELEFLAAFKPFTDPREHIQQFSDEYPILLLPVRLETRFKRIPSEAGIQPQLWVRIFPDECSVDTFESTLSETEVVLAQSYWSTVWSAGQSGDENLKVFIQNRRKAAWKGLNNNFQPGRAYWLTKNYVPINEADLPERTSEEEIILVIPTEELPSESEQNALGVYWTDTWLANGNIGLIENAFGQLVTSVGTTERASELIADYKPINFQDATPPEGSPPLVRGVFIHFPKTKDIDTQLNSWSQPASITTLPDKFVLIGYKGTDSQGRPIQVLNELGANIPDPLIIGPNPSADTGEILKQALIEDYNELATDELKEEKLGEFYKNFKDEVRSEKSKETFIADFQALPEASIEDELKQVFDNFKDEIKAASYIDYLSQRSETKWLYDFEEAVRIGMGFKVDLTPSEFDNGFDRLFVLGIKLSADETEAKADLENLIQHHHFGMNGFSIMPQGTPTNNTEEEDSGYAENEDDDETFERYLQESEEGDPDDFFTKKDGKWLAELLGIDADNASLKHVANYYQTDQCEAKTMNTALWNATIGYWMESMMTPVFSDWDETVVRHFFTHFVSGRGSIPAIRIGDQPYGILSTSTIKNLNWLDPTANTRFEGYSNMMPVIQGLYGICRKVCDDWEQFLDEVAFVGKDGDPHQNLLDALGLHASSVEFHQRYAESFAHLFNRLNFFRADTPDPSWLFPRIFYPKLFTTTASTTAERNIEASTGEEFLEKVYQRRGLNLLQSLGYSGDPKEEIVPILEKFFLTRANQLKGELIDDQPLSEKNPIRAYTEPETPDAVGKNYIHWLIENALDDHDKIKKQEGFADGAPRALLYQMLRHALELEFSNTAFNLYQSAEILNASQIKQAKVDPDFIGIQEDVNVLTKYDYLSRKEPRIIDQDITVAKHISNLIAEGVNTGQTNKLQSIVNALDHLKDVPTARLERAFVEHLDSCTYRLDAWLLGFVNFQLYGMRYLTRRGSEQSYKPGIYLGAYGWLENLKPDEEQLTPVRLTPDLKSIFDPNDNLEIVKDKFNGGYIHAPSVNQGITAAVLRNAYISNATEQDPEVYKVNLSSERVRMALAMIEGMQHGQSLGALLGYQLERGLHDRYEEAEVDTFIYELRKVFPLAANRLKETSEEEGDIDSVTQIEARNVVDGLALINHVNKTGNKNYPFGKTGLAAANADQRDIIDSEVDRLLNINDAIADLATAEGIHQVVQANYDRAANTLDTYSKGEFPQVPDVIRTPRSGVSLTNRFGVHFESGISAPPTANPREMAEPGMDKFLSDILPSMVDIACKVVLTIPTYEDGTSNAGQEVIINMDNLGLGASDLFYLLDIESAKSLTALDDYILKRVHEIESPRPDVELKINYTESISDKISLFEISPLIKSLRSMVLTARSLRNSDMLLPNEANSSSSDLNASIDFDRIDNTFEKFKESFSDVNDLEAGIDLVNHSFTTLFFEEDVELSLQNEDITEGIDAFFDKIDNQPGDFSQYTHTRAGIELENLQRIQSDIELKVTELKERWEEKQTMFDDLMAQLPAAGTDLEMFDILRQAELTVSTSETTPLPATVAEYETIVNNKKTAFDNTLADITGWLNNVFPTSTDYFSKLIAAISGLEEFDTDIIEIIEEESRVIALAEKLNDLQIIEGIDEYVTLYTNRLHILSSQFGLPQAGYGFVYDRKSSIYSAVYQKVLDYKKRWEDKQTTYDDLLIDFGNATIDEDKIEILRKAERTISTSYTIPLPDPPDTIADYEAIVVGKKVLFDAKLAEVDTWLNSSYVRFIDLVNELDKLKTGIGSATGMGLQEFDLITIETEEDKRQIVVFGEDMKLQAVKLSASLVEKVKDIQDLIDQHDAEANPLNRVKHLEEVGKQLFGEEFKVIPEFQLSSEHGGELQKTFDDKNQLLSYQTTEHDSDFPVDDWLYGIARVREKMGLWENIIMLSEGFKDIELDLTPLQLPYLENDTWLGLSFPEGYEIESDKLLYTGFLNVFDPTKSQCGLLIDEWTEVIPGKTETTGLTFQYDQPNTEPPQTMLLLTPSAFTGQWSWEDVVNTSHETLDLAKLRAIEPVHIDQTPYAQFLPATVSAVTVFPLMTLALNYAVNNGLTMQTIIDEDA